MTRRRAVNPERSFGISVGTVLLAIAAYSLWRGRIKGAEMIGSTGALLLVLGLVRPALLKWPSWIWWRLARALGHVNAFVFLTVIFVLVFAMIGLVWRVTGRDPLGRRLSKWPGWSLYPTRYRERAHYSRMY